MFVRKSQVPILLQAPFGEVYGIGIPVGITVLTASEGCCGETVQLFPGDALDALLCPWHFPKLSTLATASIQGNPRFWSRLSWRVPSPPPFQTEEDQHVHGVGSWPSCRQGGRTEGEGQAAGEADCTIHPALRSWCSQLMGRKVFRFTPWLPSLAHKIRVDLHL